jgi:hypothetical protein
VARRAVNRQRVAAAGTPAADFPVVVAVDFPAGADAAVVDSSHAQAVAAAAADGDKEQP